MKETRNYCDRCGKEIDTFKEYPKITISLNHIDRGKPKHHKQSVFQRIADRTGSFKKAARFMGDKEDEEICATLMRMR